MDKRLIISLLATVVHIRGKGSDFLWNDKNMDEKNFSVIFFCRLLFVNIYCITFALAIP